MGRPVAASGAQGASGHRRAEDLAAAKRTDRPTPTEEAAIRALRAGDPAGLCTLVELHQRWALRIAALMCGERASAEDVVADAFLQAFAPGLAGC